MLGPPCWPLRKAEVREDEPMRVDIDQSMVWLKSGSRAVAGSSSPPQRASKF